MRELVKITLGGSEHFMRPTWEAYGEIESRCGPLNALWRSIGFGTATLKDLATVVTVGMRAAGSVDGRKIDETAVSRRIYEAGPWSDEVTGPILEFLESLGWTPEQRKKLAADLEKNKAKTSSAPLDGSSLTQPQSTD